MESPSIPRRGDGASLAQRAWLLWLLTFLVPWLATLPRFSNGFVFDDVFVIVRGTFIHDLGNLPRAFTSRAMIASSLNDAVGSVALDTYRPLSIASFFADAALSGREPWAYHLTNSVLHASCTLLVEVLLGRMIPALGPGRAAVFALLFGLSPWLCEAHVFINGRADLLVTLLALSSFLVHQRTLVEARPARAWLTGLLVLLGLLAKETMVMALPLVLCVPSPAAPAGVPLQRRVARALPSLLALLVYLAARTRALGGLQTHEGETQLVAALANLPLLWLDTLLHAALPSPYVLRSLRDDYEAASTLHRAFATVVLVASLGAGAIAALRRAAVSAWALALAFCTVAPAAMITTALWPGFGRYLYLPAAGIVTLLAAGYAALDDRLVAPGIPGVSRRRLRALLGALPLAVSAFGAVLCVDAVHSYQSERVLYARAMAEHPAQAWAYGSLGLAIRREGRCAEAVPLLAHAAREAPREPRYAVHLARCLVALGELDAAREVARAGQRRFVGSRAEAGFLVAEFLTLARGDPRAEALMARCLALVPERADCLEGHALARGARIPLQPAAP